MGRLRWPEGQAFVLCAVALGAGACGRGSLQHTGPAELSVQPKRIDFGLTWVGQPQLATVTVRNDGSVSTTVAVTLSGPFTVDVGSLDVPANSGSSFGVRYDPSQTEHVSGQLTIGALQVPMTADGREIPACPAGPCEVTAFDTLSRSCTVASSPDGTACSTACTKGTCSSGVCLGSFDTCEDSNPCTVDLCSEASGCTHAPVVCPTSSDPCQVAVCDPATGCGSAPIPDGTACGENLCTSAQLSVCVAGQCVPRPRPVGTRCGDDWVTLTVPGRWAAAMAYDSDRGKMVQFGGFEADHFDDTWEWDGASWTQLHPLHSPSPRGWVALTYDSARHRTVLFGGDESLSDTWEWDGADWTQRFPQHSPPGRNDAAFAFDSDRAVAVLFGGAVNGFYTEKNDTWEWDGTDWIEKTPATSPDPRVGHVMAYDPLRKVTVLFGGGQYLSDTWEWDGTSWTKRSPATAPVPGGGPALAYDPVRQTVLYFGVSADGLSNELWEYGGADWSLISQVTTPSGRADAAVAFDVARSQLVVFGGGAQTGDFSDTWLWDGTQGVNGGAVAPPPGTDLALCYDSTRQRVVLFDSAEPWMGQSYAQTWEWNGAAWTLSSTPVSPSARRDTALAYDASRQVSVLFGGHEFVLLDGGATIDQYDADTWEWDGAQWAQRTPVHAPPPRYGHAMAYDSTRQRVVVFGGAPPLGQDMLNDLWEWDGNDWVERTPPVSPPKRARTSIAYDSSNQRLVLFGGSTVSWSGQAQALGDTWTYDGTTWTQQSPANAPSARDQLAMAYDPLRRKVLLVGGWTDGWPPTSETWEWDGTSWSLRHPADSPSPGKGGAPMAYDAARDMFVMFGGGGGDGEGSSDTWLYIPP